MIYHITTRPEWQAATLSGVYTAPSLEIEGFIHCSQASQVVKVANAFYRNKADCIILCIDEAKLASPVKREPPAHPDPNNPPPVDTRELFPHIYGTINPSAVVRIIDFAPGADGLYTLPDGVV